MIPQDIKDFVARTFVEADQDQALAAIAGARIETDDAPGPRLIRCALVASNGSLELLRVQVAQMKVDWRDVIIAGEYVSDGGDLKQARDLSVPFALPPDKSQERTRER